MPKRLYYAVLAITLVLQKDIIYKRNGLLIVGVVWMRLVHSILISSNTFPKLKEIRLNNIFQGKIIS